MLKSLALASALPRADITHSELKKLLTYNPETGEFRWNEPLTNSVKAGDIAGNYGVPGKFRYVRISVGGKSYLAHRLAWFYVYRFWPDDEIDHKDRNPQNNAISNLREASRQDNEQNCGMRRHNTSGVTGVAWDKSKKKWQAFITVNRRFKFLGRFNDKNRAIKARLAAEKRYCGEFSPNHRTGFVTAILLLMLCLSVWSPAQARSAKSALHPDCGRLWPCITPSLSTPQQARVTRGRYVAKQLGFGAPVKRRPVPLPKARPMAAYGSTSIVAHPSGCPSRSFCGCGAAVRVFGSPRRDLWLAANWLKFPRSAPGPGMVAARSGHVFVLEQHISGNTWLAWDANSGGRQTRIHPRSIAGYQIVNPHGNQYAAAR